MFHCEIIIKKLEYSCKTAIIIFILNIKPSSPHFGGKLQEELKTSLVVNCPFLNDPDGWCMLSSQTYAISNLNSKHRDEFDEATFTVTRATLKTLTTLDHEPFCYEHSAVFYTEERSTYIYLNKPF